MHFWLKRGVDGFRYYLDAARSKKNSDSDRMDVINFISKVPGLPDAPITRHDQIYQPGDK